MPAAAGCEIVGAPEEVGADRVFIWAGMAVTAVCPARSRQGPMSPGGIPDNDPTTAAVTDGRLAASCHRGVCGYLINPSGSCTAGRAFEPRRLALPRVEDLRCPPPSGLVVQPRRPVIGTNQRRSSICRIVAAWLSRSSASRTPNSTRSCSACSSHWPTAAAAVPPPRDLECRALR